jgi:hypothetical protein
MDLRVSNGNMNLAVEIGPVIRQWACGFTPAQRDRSAAEPLCFLFAGGDEHGQG